MTILTRLKRCALEGALQCAFKGILLLVLTLCLSPLSHAATYVVDNTTDTSLSACTMAPGDCTLRGAIDNANKNSGPDTINFALPGNEVQTIQLASELPTLSDNGTTIDGYSQSGASANALTIGSNAVIKIQLTGPEGPGSQFFDGLRIGGSYCMVRGLSITNFNDGIRLQGGTGNKVRSYAVGERLRT